MNINKLKISITNNCGGNCGFCYHNNSHPKIFLDLNLINSIYQQLDLLNPSKIHISGGDPLLHPDFDKIMKLALSSKKYIKLSTNSQYININQIIDYYEMGLNEVSFTLASIDENINNKIRGIKNDYENTLNLIGKISKHTNITITLTLHLANYELSHIPMLIRFIEDNKHVNFKIQCLDLFTFHFNKIIRSKFSVSMNRLKSNFKTILNLVKLKKLDNVILVPKLTTEEEVDLNLFTAYDWYKFYRSNGQSFVCNYMLCNPHVREDGSVYVCCQSPKDRCVGNLKSSSLYDLYKETIHNMKRDDGLPFPSCKHCIFFKYYN